MALLEVRGISKSFGSVRAVDGASFAAERGEIIGMLGPSGCGKSTLLRLLAGLEQPDAGTVTFDGHPLDGLAPQQRGFGLMFQDLALFPHMDVSANVSFGLRMQGADKPAIQERVGELLALVEMSAYSQRKVHELSGGERQRVALARSLAPSPKLLMLDEPLGSLDRVLRDSLQSQVRRILKEVGVTSIYVTHDRDEAFAISDRLVFMNRGSVVQSGTPEQLVAAPADEFVARSLGFTNILPGRVVGRSDSFKIECDLGIIFASGPQLEKPGDDGRVTVLIDEKAIAVSTAPYDGPSGKNVLSGTVKEKLFRGREYVLKVRVGLGELSCPATPDTLAGGLKAGEQVSVVVEPDAVRFLKGS
jgi:ABC-type Fe3+/spermidine/putrescine transport system ATPase subunit